MATFVIKKKERKKHHRELVLQQVWLHFFGKARWLVAMVIALLFPGWYF